MHSIIWSISSDVSGYSSCGREYILALDSIGQSVKHEKTFISANLDGYGVSKEENQKLKELQEKSINSDYVRIHHSVPDRFFIDKNAKLNIGYTVVESDKLPDRWAFLCNEMDAIFTASTYCKNCLISNGVEKPVFVIPHCHSLKQWNRNVRPLNFSNNKFSHRFLFAGDVTDRKGIKELMSVWNNLPIKDCSLTIKGYFNSFSEKDQKSLKENIKSMIVSEKVNSVRFYGHCIESKFMPRFIKSFDYTISPHKGEGFGLFPFESIFVGVPTIVTAATGTLEYANEHNSILLGTRGKEPASEDLIKINRNFSGCELIKIDVDHLYKILESIIENKYEFHIKDKQYFEFTSKYSYETVANLIVDSINSLL